MVEKHKRDVRITTIYEGTSEIMEMTICRDRWQLHLKSRGQYYHEKAKEMEELHAKNSNVGADISAITFHTLASLLERARVRRLTRNQHILLRIGELVAWAECTGSMARRAVRAAEGTLHEKADKTFDPETLATISRIYAREAAMKVGQDGLKWILGADSLRAEEIKAFEQTLNLTEIYQTQTGLLDDMNKICDVIYERKVEELAV